MTLLFQKNLLSTKEASEISGYHSDYLARLCRSGKIKGAQLGRTWLIDPDSLREFSSEQNLKKSERASALSQLREAEYKKAQDELVRQESTTARAVKSPIVSGSVKSPFVVVSHRAFALAIALAVVSLSAFVSQSSFLAQSGNRVFSILSEASSGFNTILAENIFITNHIAEKYAPTVAIQTSIQNAPRQEVPITLSLAPFAPLPGTSLLENPKAPTRGVPPEVAEKTQTTLHIENLVPTTGAIALSTGATLRDFIAHIPSETVRAAAQFGGFFAQTSHAILATHERATYAYVTAAPKIPATTVYAIASFGDMTARAVVETGVRAQLAYNMAVTSFITSAPQIARSSAQMEVAFGTWLTKLSSNIVSAHVAVVRSGGQLISGGTSALALETSRFATPVSHLAGAIGISGLDTLVLSNESGAENRLVAAPWSLFSAGRETVKAVLASLNDFFRKSGEVVASIASPRPFIVMPTLPSKGISGTVSVPSIGSSYVDRAIASVRAELNQRIAALSSPVFNYYDYRTGGGSTSHVTNIFNNSTTTVSGGGIGTSTTDSFTAAYFIAASTTATSTFANGINISGGCIALNGNCITTSVGAGITSLGAQYSGVQTGAGQTFATSSDTNLNLVITSSGNVHTFTPVWVGTLSVGRGGTGLSSVSNNGLLIGGPGNSITQVATSSLGLITTDIAEGTKLFFTNGRVQTYLDSIDKGFFFSTTSADYYLSVNSISSFSTTSADYWKTQRDFFSTTSATYFLSQNQNAAFSTSSATYFLAQNQGAAFSTTSSNYWLTTKTTTDLAEGANLYYQDARVNLFVAGSSTIPKTYTNNVFTAGNTFTTATFTSATTANLFATNASTTNATSTNLFASLAHFATAILDAVTITTANITNAVIATLNATTATIASLTGYNATVGTLTATSSVSLSYTAANSMLATDATGKIFATTTPTGARFIATSSVASVFPYASTTGITASYASTSNLIVSNSFTLGTLSGILKATAGNVTAGLVSLATDITGILNVSNGGTGQSSFEANAVLIGNGTGGIATTTAGTNGQVLALVNGVPTWAATTTLANISGTLAVSSGGTGSTTLGGILTGNGTGAVTSASVSAPLTFSGNTLSISQATTGTNGYLSSADFSLFNNKISSSSLSATYPLAYNSTTGIFSTAFSTTTANTFSGLNTFNGGVTIASLTGPLQAISGVVSASSTISVAYGGTGSTTLGGILVGNGAQALKSLIVGSGLTFDGTTLATSGAGITQIGPAGQLQSGGTQTLASSTSGTDFSITAAANTITFNLPSASATARGLLTGSDWSLFNNKISSTSLSGASVISYNSGTGVITTTPGTFGGSGTYTFPNDLVVTANASTSNLFATNLRANTLNVGGTGTTSISSTGALTTPSLTIGTLTGLLKASNGSVTTAVAGTDYANFAYLFPGNATTTLLNFLGGASTTAISANTAAFGATATSSFASNGALTLAQALTVPNGGTGQTSFTAGNLLYGAGSGAVQNVATTSFASANSTLTVTGTLGALVGGSASTIALNLANANTWTALQQFNGNASSTQFSATNAYFGGSATSTFTSTGALGLGTTSPFTKFTVAGNAYIGGNLTATGTLAVTGNTTLSGTATIGSTLTLSSILSCSGSQALQTNGSGDIACGTISVGGSSTGGGWTAAGGAVNGTVTLSTTTYMVAVGATTTPYAKFSVLSGSAATTTLALVPASGQTANILDIYNTSGTLGSVFTAGGFLGIGTTSPSQALSVNGNGYLNGSLTLGTALTVPNGGTGSTTLGGILTGNGTGQVTSAVVSAPLSFSGNTLSISQANASTNGFLSNTDFSLFNNKISSSSLSATFPLAYNSSTGAFTFNGLSTSTAAVVGNIPYFSGANTFANVATTSLAVSGPLNVTGSLGSLIGGSNATITYYGLATTSALVSGNLLYGSGANGVANVATTTETLSSEFSYSGTLGSLVGGASGTLSLANAGVALTKLATQAANTVLVNQTSGAASPTALATSTFAAGLYGFGTNGFILAEVNGVPTWVATTTLSTISGTLSVAKGGTGQTSFGQGWLGIDNSGAFISSTSPTVNYFTATSTTATSTINGALQVGGSGVLTAIPASSRVGINTLAPTTELDVSGTAHITGALGVGTTNSTSGTIVTSGSITAGTQFLNASSNAGAPGYSFPGDLTTGIFHPATNAIGFASGGNEWVRINGSGFLSVGSTTPTANLTVQGLDGGTSPLFMVASSSASSVKGTALMIDAQGNLLAGFGGTNVGFGGTTSPGTLLSLGTTGNNTINISATATSTFGSGINLRTGCFAVNGVCVGTNTGTLTAIGPTGQQVTSGAVLLATSTTGTDFSVTGAGNTLTFNLPFASATNNGKLSNTDWSLFNNKISSSSLSATFPLAYNSATGAFTYGGLSTSTAAVVGNIPYFSSANTFANVATTSLAVSGPLNVTGSLGSLIGGSNATITYYGLATTSALVSGNLLYGSGANGVANVATTTETLSSEFSYSGTLGSLVGGASGTLSLANAGVALTKLATQAANTVLVNQTSGAASPTALATSTFAAGLYGFGTNGFILAEVNGVPTWVATSSINNGVSSLAQTFGTAQTGAITLASSTSGADFSITNSGGAFTFNLPSASATARGLLTGSDWSLFNNKISSTSLSGASVISYNSGTGVITTTPGTFGGSGTYTFPNDLVVTANATTSSLFSTSHLSNTFAAGATGTTTITSTGFLGVGTSSPWAELSINPLATNNSSPAFAIGSSTNTTFVVTNNGNVALGTSTPTLGQFTVESGSTQTTNTYLTGNVNSFLELNIQNRNGGSSASSDFVATADNGTATTHYVDLGMNGSAGGGTPFTTANAAYLYTTDNELDIGALGASGTLTFNTTGGVATPVERARITSSGFFAVGSTTPFARLSINPIATDGSAPAFVIGSSSATSLIVTNSGRVGLGTSSPGSLLSLGDTGNNTINISATATSTFGSGINIRTGCFAVNGTCLSTGGSITGSGVANQVTYWSGTSALTGNAAFTFDGTTLSLPSIVAFANNATTTIKNNSPYAWTLATTTTGTPLIQVDTTTGAEKVTVGVPGGDVHVGIAGSTSNLVFENSSSINAKGTGTITLGTTGDVINAAVKFAAGSTSPWAQVSINPDVADGAAPAFAVGSSTGTRFVVTNNGNVGIGTSTPGSIFAIDSVANFTTSTTTFVGSGGGINISSGCFAVNGVCAGSGGVAAGTIGQFPYYAAAGTTLAATSSLFLDTTGNIGIGSTSPWADLSINPTATNNNRPSFVIGSSTGINLIVTSTGRVGIGTTSPSGSLAVAGTVFTNAIVPNGSYTNNLAAYDLGATGSRWNALWAGTVNIGTSTFSLSSDTSSSLGIYTAASGAGVEALTVHTSGNVGIGSTSPWADLSINPIATNNAAPAFAIGSSTATRFIITNAGLVGIGTTSPGSILSISGVANFTTATSTFYSTTGGLNLAGGCYAINGVCMGNTTGGNASVGAVGTLQFANTGGTFNGDASNLFWDNTGKRLFIGTSTGAQAALTIGSSTGSQLALTDNSLGNSPWIFRSINGNLFIGTSSPTTFATSTNDSALSFLANGRVGFASSTPWAQLSINANNSTGPSFVVGSSTGTSFVVATNGRVGIGTTTPWAKFAIQTNNAGDELNPAFVIATSSTATNGNVSQGPLLYVIATTTGALDYARVAIGTSTLGSNGIGIRDQLTVAGRVYTTWKYQACDLFGASLVATLTTTDTANVCGGFAYDSMPATADSNLVIQTSNYPIFARLSAGLTTSALVNEAGAVRTWGALAPASSNPVEETGIRLPTTPGTASSLIWVTGFTDLAGNSTTAGTAPSNGAYFAASTTANWQAITVSGGVMTMTNTNIATSTFATTFHKMRIELQTGRAVFIIDDKVVATNTTNVPTVNLAYTNYLALLTTGTINTNNMDISYMRLWVDDAAPTPGSDTAQTPYDVIQGADIAESYLAGDPGSYVPGLIVANATSTPNGVRLARGAYDNGIMGAVSTSPHDVTGVQTATTTRIGLIGRIPVIVSLGNGPIKQGDSITSGSTTPGIGVKALRPGRIVGQALEDMTSAKCDATLIDELAASGITIPSGTCLARIMVKLDPSFDMSVGNLIQDASGIVADVMSALDELNNAAFNQGAQLTKYVVGELVAKIAIIDKFFANIITILPGGEVNAPAGDNQVAGLSTLATGTKQIFVNNSKVTASSKIFITPRALTASAFAVTEIQPGVGFRVETLAAPSADVPFDWFFVNAYGGQNAPNISAPQTPPANPPTNTGTTTPPSGNTGNTGGGNTGSGTGTSTPPGDTTPPTVTLTGDAALQLNVGDAFTDPGATAQDDVSGDVSASITVSGTVDTATPGTYTLTYAATDAAGNTGSASRVVTVIAPATP